MKKTKSIRVKQVKHIPIASIVRHLLDDKVGYLDNNALGQPVIVMFGEKDIAMAADTEVELLLDPRQLATDWLTQLNVYDGSPYSSATDALLRTSELILSECNLVAHNLQITADELNSVAIDHRQAIADFKRTRQ